MLQNNLRNKIPLTVTVQQYRDKDHREKEEVQQEEVKLQK